MTEEEASRWILTEPEAYCHTKDEGLLEKILSDFDRETKNFFRWKIEYSRSELEEILREKSGFDFGTLKDLIPISRGPSGRIFRLKIVGSKRSMVIGKELEIRRWLSWSHLYSSSFFCDRDRRSSGRGRKIYPSWSWVGAWGGTLPDRRCRYGKRGIFSGGDFGALFSGSRDKKRYTEVLRMGVLSLD
jgi:hypothetical protein